MESFRMGGKRVAERTLAVFRSLDVTGNMTRTPVRGPG
jgi:hypothetical protein